jgi:two-component system OmpR family response regulator
MQGRSKPEMRILLIEDDAVVANFIHVSFSQEGHIVDVVANGKDGLAQSVSEAYDIFIIDRMLPGIDGLKIIRSIRAAEIGTPILILSALADVNERVEGLESGADDYLVKPFAFSELRARVNVLVRRKVGESVASETELNVGDLKLDLLTRRARRGRQEIELKPREYRLLEYLMRHANQVVTRTMLLENVWNYYFDPRTNIIDVHISRLRQKIDKGFSTSLLHTIRGAGYDIREPK